MVTFCLALVSETSVPKHNAFEMKRLMLSSQNAVLCFGSTLSPFTLFQPKHVSSVFS